MPRTIWAGNLLALFPYTWLGRCNESCFICFFFCVTRVRSIFIIRKLLYYDTWLISLYPGKINIKTCRKERIKFRELNQTANGKLLNIVWLHWRKKHFFYRLIIEKTVAEWVGSAYINLLMQPAERHLNWARLLGKKWREK